MLTPTARPTRAQLVAAPKVLLHDHLDDGMRPETVIELAAQHGYDQNWMRGSRRSLGGSSVR